MDRKVPFQQGKSQRLSSFGHSVDWLPHDIHGFGRVVSSAFSSAQTSRLAKAHVIPGIKELRNNRLLRALSAADRKLLEPLLQGVALREGMVLEAPAQAISHVYFIDSGMASVVAMGGPSHRIEVGMIGQEGMTGLSIVLGSDRPANETLVQSPGWALRVFATDLRKILENSPTLAPLLLRYAHVFLMQGSQTALANGRGMLGERLARWLLMWHDRVQIANLKVTHEFLSLLLGVRRQGVTVTLNELEASGLVRARRGYISILDRDGLRRVAGSFYGIPESEYARLFGSR